MRAVDQLRITLHQHHVNTGAAGRGTHAGDACPCAEIDDSTSFTGIERSSEQYRLQPGAMMSRRWLDRFDPTSQKCINSEVNHR